MYVLTEDLIWYGKHIVYPKRMETYEWYSTIRRFPFAFVDSPGSAIA